MPPRRTVTASFPPDLYDRIEDARGRISRSAWLQDAAERALEQAPNTSASSGGGLASAMIPGESGRGALGDPPGIESGDAPAEPRVKHASASVRAPEGQITVEEALTRCPVCNDRLDDDRVCVDPECSSHRQEKP